MYDLVKLSPSGGMVDAADSKSVAGAYIQENSAIFNAFQSNRRLLNYTQFKNEPNLDHDSLFSAWLSKSKIRFNFEHRRERFVD